MRGERQKNRQAMANNDRQRQKSTDKERQKTAQNEHTNRHTTTKEETRHAPRLRKVAAALSASLALRSTRSAFSAYCRAALGFFRLRARACERERERKWGGKGWVRDLP